MLLAYVVVAKFYVWLWRLKPPQARPPITRHNLSLGLIDLVAMAAMVAAVFILIMRTKYKLAIGWGVGLLVYCLFLRWLVIGIEVRRLMKFSPRWTERSARHHVRKHARLVPFQ